MSHVAYNMILLSLSYFYILLYKKLSSTKFQFDTQWSAFVSYASNVMCCWVVSLGQCINLVKTLVTITTARLVLIACVNVAYYSEFCFSEITVASIFGISYRDVVSVYTIWQFKVRKRIHWRIKQGQYQRGLLIELNNPYI